MPYIYGKLIKVLSLQSGDPPVAKQVNYVS